MRPFQKSLIADATVVRGEQSGAESTTHGCLPRPYGHATDDQGLRSCFPQCVGNRYSLHIRSRQRDLVFLPSLPQHAPNPACSEGRNLPLRANSFQCKARLVEPAQRTGSVHAGWGPHKKGTGGAKVPGKNEQREERRRRTLTGSFCPRTCPAGSGKAFNGEASDPTLNGSG